MPCFPVPSWISTFGLQGAPRSFGARREGRRHAGCDIYAPIGSEVLAIAKGRVIEAGPFLWGTQVVAVDHGAYGIVRYAEINIVPGISLGVEVVEKQRIGAITRLKNPDPKKGDPHPMLHLEWYSGRAAGRLTCRESKSEFKRREDLKDPTRMLHQLWTL